MIRKSEELGSFVERYIMPIVYPAQLTPEIQYLLGVGVLIINLAVYTWIWRTR